MSPILVVGALLGQMKLPKPLAEKVASLFGLTESEKRMLNEVPTRGMPMPPTDPLLYRFYETRDGQRPGAEGSDRRGGRRRH
jgi:cyanate lyase